jgi:transcriptional regulator with XRE-family HTH domain
MKRTTSPADRTASSPAAPLAELRARLGLTRPLFSRLLGYSERAVADWEAGRKAPSAGAARRIEELRRLEHQLARLMDAKAVGAWLCAPNGMLEGQKPLEVVERGEIDRLWHLCWLLESGTPL